MLILSCGFFSAYAQNTVIDFDYKKQFLCNYLVVDLEGNGVMDNLESPIGISTKKNIKVFFNYKDFGSAGSLMSVTIDMKAPDGKTETMTLKFEDVKLLSSKLKDAKAAYTVTNKLGEMLLTYLEDKAGISYFVVYDVSTLAY